MKQVTIAGMGPGSAGCMTQEVCRAVKQADVLIGSERLIAPYTDQRTVKAVTAPEIIILTAQRYLISPWRFLPT